jgi:hypothetical protein
MEFIWCRFPCRGTHYRSVLKRHGCDNLFGGLVHPIGSWMVLFFSNALLKSQESRHQINEIQSSGFQWPTVQEKQTFAALYPELVHLQVSS